jgi:hypothetical protein
MTGVLDVRSMRVRYRVAADGDGLRRQLDSVLARVRESELEPALVRRGVASADLVCVRSVHASARLDLAGGEAAAAETWSAAIADAVATALGSGGATVVRYRSRRAALADLACGVAAGRLERAWAWRRLGLWSAPETADARSAAGSAVLALAAEPRSIVGVLVHVARSGLLPRLVALVEPEHWTALAQLALESAGADPAVVTALPAADELDAVASAESERVALRIGRASLLADVAGAPLSAETARALAVLAWLETDPAGPAASAPAQGRGLVQALARTLAGDEVAAAAAPVSEPDEVAPRDASADELRGGAPGPEAELPAATDSAEEAAPAPALTRFAGLLFLLGALDELGLPAAVTTAAPLARRPLRWSLHRLALSLAPLEPDDPAALAFAGLPPDAEPPGDDEVPQSEAETLELGRLARSVVEHLRERLEQPHATPDELLDFVCRRRGEIVFDPAWLEVRLPLDEVSIELRRAGLDLDPGWLAWLGCVVRFVYA